MGQNPTDSQVHDMINEVKFHAFFQDELVKRFSNINLNLSPKSDLPSSEHWAALGYVQVPFETRASHISLVNIPVPHVSGQHRLTSFAHDPERSTHMLPAPSHLLPGPQFGVDARHSSLFLGTHAYWEIEEIAMKSFFELSISKFSMIWIENIFTLSYIHVLRVQLCSFNRLRLFNDGI